jgi:hypothetical protein
MTDSFKPKSEKIHISSSLAPKVMYVTLVVPEVGCVIFAKNWGLLIEKTRILSVDATRTLLEEADHKNQDIELASSGGRFITRRISRERVSRMLSFEESTVAMYAPFGLGTV